MKVTVFPSLEECLPRREAWNRLAASVSNDVALTYEWHCALQQAHDTNVRVAWLEDGSDLVGIVPWHAQSRSLRHIPLKFASPLGSVFTNHDSLLLADTSAANIRRVLSALEDAGLPWDVFAFPVSSDSPLFELHGNAAGLKAEQLPTHASPFLPLHGTADELLAKQSSNFRYNIRRKTRALEATGKIELVKVHAAAELAEALEQIAQIERSSWKEEAASSITSRPWEERFYRALGQRAAEQGWLRIYLLRKDGEPIGYDFGLLYKSKYFMLKTSYVESLAKLSPGTVLRWRVIQDLYAVGANEHDFLGDADSYKLAWSKETRRHAGTMLFNRGFLPWLAHRAGTLRELARRRQPTASPQAPETDAAEG